MAEMKQILVVDDAAEMLEFLRSMLQVSNSDHQVMAVPSAEEAMFELRLTKFDLLVTDVRLPGMSGFDLVRHARKRNPDLPVIMITAYMSEQGQQEANDLGIYRYFRKPLDTDSVLTAVQHALYGEPEPSPIIEAAPIIKVNVRLTDDMERRLDGLRADTGAFGLLLVAGGHVVYESGGHRDLHPDRIAAIVNQKMAHSSMLAEELGEANNSFNLLYQSGTRYEIYSVNIGRDYFITLLFEASARRGRIGTVWVFVQKAVKELESILPKLNLGPVPTTRVSKPLPKPPVPEVAASKQPSTPVESRPKPVAPPPPVSIPEPEPQQLQPEPEPIQLSEAEMAEFVDLFEGIVETETSGDLDDFWDSALGDMENAGQASGGISLAEAQKMGLVSLPDMPVSNPPVASQAEPTAVAEPEPAEPEPEPINVSVGDLGDLFANITMAGDEVDLDDFWDSALDEGDVKEATRGISFEDAIKQGLLSGDFGAKE